MMSQQFPAIRPLSIERSHQLASSPERSRLFDQIVLAVSQEEIDTARAAQQEWLIQNPDDFGMLEAGERLAYAEEALSWQDSASRDEKTDESSLKQFDSHRGDEAV
jgi:hypothetical protein